MVLLLVFLYCTLSCSLPLTHAMSTVCSVAATRLALARGVINDHQQEARGLFSCRSLGLSCDILLLFSPGPWCQLSQLQHQGEVVRHMLWRRHPVFNTCECLCQLKLKMRFYILSAFTQSRVMWKMQVCFVCFCFFALLLSRQIHSVTPAELSDQLLLSLVLNTKQTVWAPYQFVVLQKRRRNLSQLHTLADITLKPLQ